MASKKTAPCPTVKECGPNCLGCHKPKKSSEKQEREQKKTMEKKEKQDKIKKNRQREKKRRSARSKSGGSGESGSGVIDKNITYKEISQSAGDHCCACFQALNAYVKEVCKLVWCVTGSSSPGYETRLDQLLCDMIDIIGFLGQDFCTLIGRIILSCKNCVKNTNDQVCKVVRGVTTGVKNKLMSANKEVKKASRGLRKKSV